MRLPLLAATVWRVLNPSNATDDPQLPDRRLVRAGAVASLVTAVAGVASSYVLMHPPRYEAPGSHFTYEALYLLAVVGQIITVLAVRHLHRQPERRWGRLGTIAAWLTLTGLGLMAIKQSLVVISKLLTLSGATWVAPALMAPGTILSLIGLPLIGVAVIRARTLPRWFGWTFALSQPISILGLNLLLPEFPAAVVSSVFPIAIGVGLWIALGSNRSTAPRSVATHHS